MSTFSYNDENYPLPTGAWKDRSLEDLYDDLVKVETQYHEIADKSEKQELLSKNGFNDYDHLENYNGYVRDNIDYAKYAQKKMDEQTNAYKKQMNESASALSGTEEMAPISGISLEKYANISAQLAQGGNYADLLKAQGIEQVSWEKAAEGWQDRMSKNFTVVNEFSKFFMGAGQGQFGETAKEVAVDMSGGKAKSDNPVSLELFAEISAAQSSGVAQGKDASAILATYGLNAADWGTIGVHWGTKMMSDMNVAIKFGELLTKFTDKFNAEAPSAGGDIDF